MKKIITLLSLLLFTTASNAQNIVPNYSFEEADSCPSYLNDRSYEYSLGCVAWGQATSGTADYYNACDTAATSIGRPNPIVGVPTNRNGYQYAYEGAAYAGICIYNASATYYKEYLITNIPALEIDTAYEVTIHVSLANYCEYATDGMGVLFTTYGSPEPYSANTIVGTPQIDYTSFGVISDTVNWITLSGMFIADSNYTTLIGGFKNASEMTITEFNGNPIISNASYYYIDAVIVEKLSSTGLSSIGNNSDVKIYPNPFSDYATLLFNNKYKLSSTLTIFNIQSQIVQQMQNITSDRVNVDRNNLPAGFYYYQLSNAEGIVANGKLMIQ